MLAECFIDTNIFLYSLSTLPGEKEKQAISRKMLLNERWGWSVQVAGEFYSVVTSPNRPFRVSPKTAFHLIENWMCFPTAPISPSTVLEAMIFQQRFQLAYWDSMILASAKQLNISVLYSEDFSNGQVYDGIKVFNPFKQIK